MLHTYTFFVKVRGHAQRLVVKPIAKLYNTVDNFIFQTYGYVAWNSPRYMARVKNAFQYIRTIVRKYIWTERVPAEHRCPSPRHPGSTPGLSPTITDRDSVWIEWGTLTLPDEGNWTTTITPFQYLYIRSGNEWSFYIRGSGDRQGISVTQSAWKGYQDYMQQLGLPPVDSPSRITVQDFEAYQAAIAMTGRTIPVISVTYTHSSPSLLNGTSSSSDTPVSSFSSSNTLLSSSTSSMTTLTQSPEYFTPFAKLDLKDFSAREEDISDVLSKPEIATPHLHPFSGPHEDLEGSKYCSINITARKGDFNLRSINSFGDIEALLSESFGTHVSHVDGHCASVLRHSVLTSPSIYSQESASSEEASLVDTPLLDVDFRSSSVECVYEDDVCSDDIISVTASDACDHDYLVTSLCDDVTSFERDLADAVADSRSAVPMLQTFSGSQDSFLLEADISDLGPAEASIKWPNLCCPAETVDDEGERHIPLINDDDSSSQFSGVSSTRDSVVSEDDSTNVPKLNISSVQQCVSFPQGTDTSDDNDSCIALKSDNTSAPFSFISSLDNSLTPVISDDEVRRGRNTVSPTTDRVTGGQSHRVDFHGMRPHTVRLVNEPGYLDLQTVQEQLQTRTKPRPPTAVNMYQYRPVKSHARQHLPTPKWTSHEFVSTSASTTPGVCNVSMSALEYIERRRVRLSREIHNGSVITLHCCHPIF
jgi:uncharacterized protein (UPF0297 family)